MKTQFFFFLFTYSDFNETSGVMPTVELTDTSSASDICPAQVFYTVGSFMGILSSILLLLVIIYMHKKYKAVCRMSVAVAPLSTSQTGVTLESMAPTV